jgi:transcriptional regulator with AAA-type ATPase domain
MAQGRLHSLASNPEAALRAFTLAHGHFHRLGAVAWAQRAASNAATMALAWADLPAYRRWAALRGPLPPHWLALEEAYLTELYSPPDQAQARFLSLVEAYPDFAPAWEALASFGANQERWELVRQALPHCQGRPLAVFLEAALGPLDHPVPEGTEPETRVTWEAHRLLRGARDAAPFWEAWEACPNQFLRLDLGLRVLERRPDLRQVGRLLTLQAIADRAASPGHDQRLTALWPRAGSAQEPSPRALLETWLAQQPCPHWLVWPEGQGIRTLGAGDAPPAGALGRLAQEGTLAPFEAGAWIWQGHALLWEGSPVGALLQGLPPEAPPTTPVAPRLLAPWVAHLRQTAPALTFPEAGLLLTDGSEPMATILLELDRVAPSDLPVLILGPTGCGKELAARELHQRSGRSGPLVAVNCSAFAESLLESELFGHTKGAFTGAHQDRRGAIEAARGGTLFLDEVADLSPRLQSLLLRVLQEREIRRVGSDHTVKVDVRFAAATHRPLEELAESGLFRRDLFFRLQGAVLHLPPLSARRHEFPFLVPRLAIRAAEAAKRPVPALAPGLPQALARLPWPGNVRELLHALERAMLRCESGLLKPSHFPELDTPTLQSRTWEDATHAFQRRLLLDTLQACHFRVADAAQTLGLARPALYATAKRLGVDLVAARVGEKVTDRPRTRP